MSRIREELTLPTHPQLLDKLNNTSIAIKVHHIDSEEKRQKPEAFAKVAANYKAPTWEEISDLLLEAYHAINQQRINPRRRY